MLQTLEKIFADFGRELAVLTSQPDILNLKSNYLGKKGRLSEILKGLKDVDEETRKQVGPLANKIKDDISDMTQQKIVEVEVAAINQKLNESKLDLGFRKSLFENGQTGAGFHPITLIQQEIEDIFLSMGFEVLDGPHIDDEFHNFEALNIPSDHPARDMQDTFWFKGLNENQKGDYLLRTHTSSVQHRGMKTRKPPIKFIVPGKVFRCERTDASHEMAFHQLEGMLIDEDISVANLIYFMKTLLSEIFKKEVTVRLRPGFFPFVEPGFELDIKCLICGGKGCSVCKHVGWVELLPCGMVHPNVLKHGGIDPVRFKGFAFGLGLDRLVMMKYAIEDIRHFHGGDLRFISQFRSYV
jgi:phenylalanyl-tRNA synthetase alpha chain